VIPPLKRIAYYPAPPQKVNASWAGEAGLLQNIIDR